MNVIDIKNPKFLKRMKIKELESLSKDIREFIIEKVSKNGGHLSSNLGVVDLTIAVHKVFDSPKDKIIFDVSHQSYTHKILTGRASKFDTLRKDGGLSGFQKRSESVHDAYEAGHSSTSLSAALGYAIARDKLKKNYNVIAIIGDGSISNGLSYEALNHIGYAKTKLIIILNDNEMSISKNVGALHNSLDKIRSNFKYNTAKNKTKSVLNKVPFFGQRVSNSITNIKKSFKTLYLKEGVLFEELGIKYYGPINGHDYREMISYLNMAKHEDGPVIIHVITEKGKGYKYAEEDKIGAWHGTIPFDIETGMKNKKDTSLITWSEVISNHLMNLTQDNKNIMVITPAMSSGSKLIEFSKKFPNNFIDVGIAEEHALVLANGMAQSDLIPFVSIYSTFLQRGYDEVLHDIARMNSHVIIGVDRAGIVGEDGETHQGIYDLSFLLAIPNIVISTPSNSVEAGNLLYTAISTNRPFIIRYSKDSLEYKKESYKRIPIGSWKEVSSGKDAIIITYGNMINNAIEVKKLLSKKINIGIINALYQKPIDEYMFKSILEKYKNIYIYEEKNIINSFGSYLVNYAADCKYKGNIKVFAINDEFVLQGSKKEVLKRLNLDPKSISDRIMNDLKRQ